MKQAANNFAQLIVIIICLVAFAITTAAFSQWASSSDEAGNTVPSISQLQKP